MLVCLCRRVTSSRLRQVIADGARSVDDVAHRCEAGTDCGSCVEDIEAMLQDAPAARPAARAAVRLMDLALGSGATATA